MENFIKFFEGLNDDQRKKVEERLSIFHENIEKGMNNYIMFDVYDKYTTPVNQFNDVGDALNAYENNKVIIHFIDIQRYGRYTCEEYLRLNNQLYDKIIEANAPFPKLKQIIPADKRQKMVFVCPKNIAIRIKKLAEEFFDSSIRMIKDDDHVEMIADEKIVNNRDEAEDLFRQFLIYVLTNNH